MNSFLCVCRFHCAVLQSQTPGDADTDPPASKHTRGADIDAVIYNFHKSPSSVNALARPPSLLLCIRSVGWISPGHIDGRRFHYLMHQHSRRGGGQGGLGGGFGTTAPIGPEPECVCRLKQNWHEVDAALRHQGSSLCAIMIIAAID